MPSGLVVMSLIAAVIAASAWSTIANSIRCPCNWIGSFWWTGGPGGFGVSCHWMPGSQLLAWYKLAAWLGGNTGLYSYAMGRYWSIGLKTSCGYWRPR